MRFLLSKILTALAVLAAMPSLALAAWPEKQVTIIVPFSAGGNTDIVARYIAEALSAETGQNVIVENKPGADSSIGTALVANSEADGHTILFTTNSFVINMSLYPDRGYDALADFAPITLLGSYPYVLVVNPSVQAKDFKELLDLSKESPLLIGTNSAGTMVATALLQQNTGLQGDRIPYKGAGAMVPALLGGEVQMALTGIANVEQHIKAGTLKPLVVNTEERSPALPDVPTVNESGLVRYSDPTWNGFLAPDGTPPETLAAIHAALLKVLAQPELKQKIEATTLTIQTTTQEEFGALIKADVERWGALVKEMNLTVQ